MEGRKDICVVMPTYRNAGTVLDVVRRVLAQDLPVIVVNDGSPDDTGRLLAESGLPLTVPRQISAVLSLTALRQSSTDSRRNYR